MKIAVVTKPNMLEHSTRLGVLDKLAAECNCDVVVCACASDIPLDANRVLVFGGDGTVLEAVRALGGKDVAVLGVNLGNMGFLTTFEQDVKPEAVVSALKDGKCVSRMLLDIQTEQMTYCALNEVVIKTAGTRPITLDVIVDGRFVDSYHSDGLIISSPAGSTAYSLSAGGPVLAPDVDALVINPICAHSLHSRPLVVSALSMVEVKVTGGAGASAVVDGNIRHDLPIGNGVVVTKSGKTARFISIDGENFYTKLLQKMNRWGTTLR